METRLLSVVPLDAIMAFTVGSLADASDTNVPQTWTNCGSLNIDDVSRMDTMTDNNNVGQYGSLPNTNSAGNRGKRRSRGGRKLMDRFMKFKTYLHSSITQLPSFCICAYKEDVVAQNLKINNLMSINEDKQNDCSDAEHLKNELDNVQKPHALVFPILNIDPTTQL